MNIENITNQVIYLDQLEEVIITSDINQATSVVIKETDGATILEEVHFADFSGQITLDLSRIFAPYATPEPPAGVESVFDTSQELSLTIVVDSVEYPFTLVLLNSNAKSRLSDIDFLRIPDDDTFPLSLYTTTARSLYFYSESGAGRKQIRSTGASSRCVYTSFFSLPDIARGPDGTFRILVEGTATFDRYSPVYKPQPGTWQRFLFRNRYGLLEYFPMNGALQLDPAYTFDNAKYGKLYRTARSECDLIFTQHTGYLTREACKALIQMLKTGYAFHYNDGEWKRIVIDSADVSLNNNETLRGQSFKFRYQEQTESITI